MNVLRSSVNIWRWTYVRYYYRSAMTQKLFSTDPGNFRRAGHRWFGSAIVYSILKWL